MDDNVLNTPGLMDPSTEFGNIMQHAMKIKGHQMEQDRKRFETWPLFLQNTLWMQGEALALRELPLSERLPGATALKAQGNEAFRKKAYAPAIECYEAALGSFRYAKQLDPDWKKKGIKDETILLVDDRADAAARLAAEEGGAAAAAAAGLAAGGEAGGDEAGGDEGGGKAGGAVDAALLASLEELFVSCYNNLAACYLGRAVGGVAELGGSIAQDFTLCVAACDAALELQPGSSKALYRRAKARVEPLTSTDDDATSAIADLAEAARLSPDDKAVRSLLAKLRRAKAEAKAKDKSQLQGMFGRGELYDAPSLKAMEERAEGERRLAEKSDGPRTAEDCEREQREAEAAIEHLKERGRHEEAASLELKVAEHRKQLESYKAAAAAAESAPRHDPRHIDFSNPTAEQVEDAKKHGIDLFDPLVVQELQRLQNEREGEEGEGADADGGRARRKTSRHRSRRPPPPDVSAIPLREIKRRLVDLEVPFDEIEDDRPALEALLLASYRDPERWEPEGEGESDDDDERPQTWVRWAWSYCSVM